VRLSGELPARYFTNLFEQLPGREDRNPHVGADLQKIRVATRDDVGLQLQRAFETPNAFGIVVVRIRTHAFGGQRVGGVQNALPRSEGLNQGALFCPTYRADLSEDSLVLRDDRFGEAKR